MFICEDLNLEKTICCKDKRIINLPQAKNLEKNKYDLKTDKISKEINFVHTKDSLGTYIIDKNIGIKDETVFSVFFAKKYMVLEVKSGSLYVKDLNNEIFEITSDNEKFKYCENENLIIFKTIDDIINYCEAFSSKKMPNIENKQIDLKCSYNKKEDKMFYISKIDFKNI